MYNVLLYEENENGQKVLSNKSNVRTLKKGDGIFKDATFDVWEMPLNYLTSGKEMFAYSLVANWDVDLPLLEDGTQMFEGTFIKSFDSNLNSLKTGDGMFRDSTLEVFNSDMNSLTKGIGMFQDCESLSYYTSFNNSLKDGTEMFKGCTQLKEFVSTLGSLDNGTNMFTDCTLSPTSAAIIISTIKDQTKSDEEHTIDIGIDANDDYESITKFAQQAGWNTWMEMMQAIENKGWKSTWYAHGTMIESDKIIVNRDFDVSLFNVTGLSEEFSLSGNMNVNVLGLIDSYCDTTITFTNVTLGGQPLGGMDVIKLKVPFDKQGYIPTSVNFKVLFTTFVEETMYLLHGQFSIAGAESNISVATNGLRAEIKNDFVWVEYDNNGKYVDSNLINLTNGYNLFYNNYDLITFESELPNITSAENMFYNCNKMTSFTSNLRTLENGSHMFYNCNSLANLTITDLTGLTDGNYMFYKNKITSWNTPLPNLSNGSYMFYKNNFTSWNTPLPNLSNGSYMFLYNYNLISFESNLNELVNGYEMFGNCSNLTSWNTPLPKLTNGAWMFYYNVKLTSFETDLPELTNGDYMFYDCTNLTSFVAKTPKLSNGYAMFRYCPLTHFRGDLKKLTSASNMFRNSKFDADTLSYVIDQLKKNENTYNASITLGVDKSLFNDKSIRTKLNVKITDEQPGEDEKNTSTKYTKSSISNAKNKTWLITTYWN